MQRSRKLPEVNPIRPEGRGAYMQKTCDVAEKAILAKKKLPKKCVNRDIM